MGDAAHLMPPFLGQGLCAGMRDATALAWRLAAVVKGTAPETILAAYGPERSAHVQEIIYQAVELGRLICMLDPSEVAARNEQMRAALKDPALALKPPPEPRLGDGGAYLSNDPHAGLLSVQGRVRHRGREGLLDDVVGPGWQLLLRDSIDVPSPAGIRLPRLVVAAFGPGGDTVDLDGTYANWFARLGAAAVLVRPDFYVFGTSSAAYVSALLASAEQMYTRDRVLSHT